MGPALGEPGFGPRPIPPLGEFGLQASCVGVNGETDAVLVGEVSAMQANGHVGVFLAADRDGEVVVGVSSTERSPVTVGRRAGASAVDHYCDVVGLFIFMTAFRSEDPRAVADAIVRYSAAHDVPAEVMVPETEQSFDAAWVELPAGGWSVVNWPRGLRGHIKISRWMSGELGVVASMVEVYDSDAWNHVALDRGEVRDRFATMPEGKTSDLTSTAEAKRRWVGNAGTVAELFGRQTGDVAPYFRRPSTLRVLWSRLTGKPLGVKAFPDDEWDLDDDWVFTDFWRRAGITYPDPSTSPGTAHVVRFHPPGSEQLPYDTTLD